MICVVYIVAPRCGTALIRDYCRLKLVKESDAEGVSNDGFFLSV